MKHATVQTLMLGTLLFLASSAHALTVADGGSLTIDDSTSSGSDAIVCSGSATLTLALTKSDGLYVVDRMIRAQAGTVTIDLSACSDAPVLFAKDFRANMSGHIVFTGGTRVLLGPRTHLGFTEAVTSYPRYGFAALEGPSGFRVAFTNSATLAVAMPSGVNWSVCPGSYILVCPENGLASILGSDDAISLTDFDVAMLATNTFPTTATVTVPAGRTLMMKPMSVAESDFTLTSPSSPICQQNVVLSDSTSTLLVRGVRLNLYGKVSGTGTFRVYENFTAAACEWRSSGNPFSGTIVLDSPAGKDFGLDLVTENVLSGACEVKLLSSSSLYIHNSQSVPSVYGSSTQAKVYGYSNSSLTLGNVRGKVRVAKAASSVSNASAKLTGAEDGAVLWHDSTLVPTISDDIPCGRADVTRTVADGTYSYHCFGDVSDSFPPPVEDGDAIDIKARTGSALDVTVGQNDVSLSVAEGATVTVERASFDLSANASLWLDASVASSVVAVTNASGTIQTTTDGKPYVQEWYDCRASVRVPYLFNYRYYNQSNMSTKKGAAGPTLITQPILGSATLNGLSVMDFSDSTRRLFTASSSGYAALAAKFCVMVFNSEKGGGKALLGTKTGALARGSSTSRTDYTSSMPITTNGSVSVWLNGTSVDPTTTGLSGGWDIVAIDTTGLNVNGLAFGGTAAMDGPGGSRYAEVVFFDRVLTANERITVEKYLAKKWGLTSKCAPSYGTVTLSGAGSVELPADYAVTGNFRGNISLADGASLTLGSAVPPTAETVSALSGRVRWMDPDESSSVAFSKQASRPLEVICLKDRSDAAGYPVLIGNNVGATFGSIRAPWLNDGVRGYGPKRAWLDYANIYARASGNETGGNYLKFSSDGTESGATSLSVRTAFVVVDMNRGGSPVLDSAYGNKIIRRSSVDDPIWPSGTTDELTGGTTWLNGVVVDGSTVSYGKAGPQVLGFTTKENPVSISHLGAYSTTEGKFGTSYGEVLGESIFFDCALSDADRQKVETYLLWKWLGTLPSDYDGYFSESTISGAGAVTAKTQALLPSFSSDYAGTVTVSGSSFGFTFDKATASVPDALLIPQATLSLPSNVSVSIAVSGGRLKAGRYPLIQAKSISSETTFTLGEMTGVSDEEAARASLSVVGQTLVLDVKKQGFAVVLR